MPRGAVGITVEGQSHDRPNSYKTERAGAVGPGSHAEHTTFNEFQGNHLGGIDLATLTAELGQLKTAMQAKASGTAQYAALAAVSEAEDAAKASDTPTLISKLKAAGKWAFDTATQIGVNVAAKAIGVAIGLPS